LHTGERKIIGVSRIADRSTFPLELADLALFVAPVLVLLLNAGGLGIK
jgi:hypothetical protein